MKTILVSARIKPETYEAVKKAAATDRRLLGAYLRLVLEDHVAALAKKPEKAALGEHLLAGLKGKKR